MGRAMMRLGRKYQNGRLVKAGKALLDQANNSPEVQNHPSSPNDAGLLKPIRDWDEEVLDAALGNWPKPTAKA
jgi:hypothetical protein